MTKVDVITGFLGSGKTTFLKNILSSGAFKHEKIAIIVNDFGSIQVDATTLKESGCEIFEISGGCICCSVKNRVIEILEKLAISSTPDRVFIEPSGIFNPNDLPPILSSKTISTDYVLNGIYTLIDLDQFQNDKIRQTPFYRSQLIHGHHLIISKLDKSAGFNHEEIRNQLCTINSNAKIHIAPIEEFDSNNVIQLFMKNVQQDKTQKKVIFEPVDKSHSDIDAFDICVDGNISKGTITALIENLNSGYFGSILRMKGFIQIDGEVNFVNYASNRLELSKGDSEKTFLTFIGFKLNNSKIIDFFKNVSFTVQA